MLYYFDNSFSLIDIIFINHSNYKYERLLFLKLTLEIMLYFKNLKNIINKIFYLKKSSVSVPNFYPFLTTELKNMPILGVKCPHCEGRGKTVWVIPGHTCPNCGTICNKDKSILTIGMILFTCGITLVSLAIAINGTQENFILSNLLCDAPKPWGIFFQDSASPQMEGIVEMHNYVFFQLLYILGTVGLMVYAVVVVFAKVVITYKYVKHGSSVELFWTISPGLVLIFISVISFQLLYLIDEVSDVNMTLYAEGHQWYWSYQYPDFLNNLGDFIEYDSYLTPESDLVGGAFRMLEVDNKVIMPETTHSRFVMSSGDVIHSYACPSLGLKADAYPGRLNQSSTLINRLGSFLGQCSEVCGMLHSSMPIFIKGINLEKFFSFLWEQ